MGEKTILKLQTLKTFCEKFFRMYVLLEIVLRFHSCRIDYKRSQHDIRCRAKAFRKIKQYSAIVDAIYLFTNTTKTQCVKLLKLKRASFTVYRSWPYVHSCFHSNDIDSICTVTAVVTMGTVYYKTLKSIFSFRKTNLCNFNGFISSGLRSSAINLSDVVLACLYHT